MEIGTKALVCEGKVVIVADNTAFDKITSLSCMYRDDDSTIGNEGGTMADIDRNFFQVNNVVPNKHISPESFY